MLGNMEVLSEFRPLALPGRSRSPSSDLLLDGCGVEDLLVDEDVDDSDGLEDEGRPLEGRGVKEEERPRSVLLRVPVVPYARYAASAEVVFFEVPLTPALLFLRSIFLPKRSDPTIP